MIRLATTHDAAAIARVHVSSWKETYAGLVPRDYLDGLDVSARTAGWERQLAEGKVLTLVAEVFGFGIVGFACGGSPQKPELGFDCELHAIYLLRAAQGRGLGRALFERFSDEMRGRGHDGMYCWVLRGNPTEGFYRHLGGERGGEEPVELGGARLTHDLFLWRLAVVRATT